MKKSIYKCTECGYQSVGHFSKCPSCGTWNSLEEVQEEKKGKGKMKTLPLHTKKLRDVVETGTGRIETSLVEFNRVLGGGIVLDGVTILTARPGAGKSTLLLQIAHDLGESGYKVLYASGEESESQIKNRGERILGTISDNVWIFAGNSLDRVLEYIHQIDADAIILDSIQTFQLEDITSRPGSPTQTMECAYKLVEEAKNPSRPRMVFLVGQLTKDDSLAGVRALEHLVDTVLFMDADMNSELRILRATKNRFGSTGEMGFFSMDEGGLLSIDNPSLYFMTQRATGEEVSGSAHCILREGSRPVIVEVESLVSHSYSPYPQRICECMNRDQLGTLLFILEERAKMPLYEKNVVLKTTGGIRLKENASNLAVLMSVASALRNVPIDNKTLFIGEVGLTGELKHVPAMELRLKEGTRMGYETIYTPPLPDNLKEKNFGKTQVLERRHITEIIREIFV